jgi:hypothetical protein
VQDAEVGEPYGACLARIDSRHSRNPNINVAIYIAPRVPRAGVVLAHLRRMSRSVPQSSSGSPSTTNATPEAPHAATPVADQARPQATPPREIGGRDGPEPTRFGDWEKNGRCIDF